MPYTVAELFSDCVPRKTESQAVKATVFVNSKASPSNSLSNAGRAIAADQRPLPSSTSVFMGHC